MNIHTGLLIAICKSIHKMFSEEKWWNETINTIYNLVLNWPKYCLTK